MIRELRRLLREIALFVREKRKATREQRRRDAKKTVAGIGERARVAKPVSSDDAKEGDEDDLPPDFQRILEEGARVSAEFDEVTKLYSPPTEPAAPVQAG